MDLMGYCRLLQEGVTARLTPALYLSMLLDIAMGMNYISLLNIIHRDMNMGTHLFVVSLLIVILFLPPRFWIR